MPGVDPAPSFITRIRNKLINREVMTYLVFGVLTTVINLAVYYGLRPYMDWTIANGIAWIVAVEFAFITNRTVVFRSKGSHFREMPKFYLSRLATLAMEYAALFIMNDWIGMDDRISKLVTMVFVVIGNYILSKLIVFAHPANKAPEAPREE